MSIKNQPAGWEDNGFITDGKTDVPAAMDQLENLMGYISEGYSRLSEEELR
ncbi:MAG: hypothetical protein JO301_17465, partial [Chitinophagaceae bacterium]|nr:hypothetical protein [Chitinophagaceae bacterium]